MRSKSVPPAARKRARPANPPVRLSFATRVRARMRAQGPFRLLGAFLLVAGGSATALNGGAIMDGMAPSQETIDAIRDRSPGARTAAQMSKGKRRLVAVAPVRTARALPRIRDARGSGVAPVGILPAPLAGPVVAPTILAAPVVPAGIVGGPAGGVAFAGPGGAPGGGGVFLPTVGGGFGPGGGGGGGGIVFLPPDEETNPPIDGTTPTLPPIVTAPIPEPASWLMMILGFGTVGAALRRRPQSGPWCA